MLWSNPVTVRAEEQEVLIPVRQGQVLDACGRFSLGDDPDFLPRSCG